MKISEMLEGAERVAIFGHVRPDGDCVGSTMGLYNYILDNYPEIHVDVYLERFADSFLFLPRINDVLPEYTEGTAYDTVFVLDASSRDRIGANGLACVNQAAHSYNIDHHRSNPGDVCAVPIVKPEVSSASEVLYYLLEEDRVTRAAAECIYLGIVHDTGVFRFSCTGRKTLEAVGALIATGVDFARIINETYYCRTFNQTRVTGLVMQNCQLALSGKVVYGYLTSKDMEEYQVTTLEMDGIIDALREVQGTEVAIFLYPIEDCYKISLRSQYSVDVSRICQLFGGGGHARAAGCSIKDTPEEIIKKLLAEIEKQL
jgi:phosphoesterase RecJ-like protein